MIPNSSYYQEGVYTVSGKVLEINPYQGSFVLELDQEKVIVYSIDISKIHINDIVEVEGEFQYPKSSIISNTFDYKSYLKRKNIFFIASSKGEKVLSSSFSFKHFFSSHINNPYLQVFLLGDKSGVSRLVLESYQENGISHLFAISGMHITLLSFFLTKILGKFFSEEKTYIGCVLFFLFYLFLIGESPSVFRGVFFYICFTGNRIYYFYIKKENLFLFVLSIALLFHYESLWDIGFQFSYTISFALLKCSSFLSSKNYFLSLLKVSSLSFLVSIPICLYHYYQINLFSIFYNLFFVPFISFFLFPFSFLVFFFPFLNSIYLFFCSFLENISLYLSHISFGKIVFCKGPFLLYFFYELLIFFFLIFHKKRYIYIFLIFLFLHFITPFFSSSFVEFLDVGQGDSIILHSKRETILIDTGGSNLSSSIITHLKSFGIGSIDYLILSHGDYDHMGEAINLVNNFKVEKVIFNCGTYNDLEKELIKVLDKKKIKYYSCIKEFNIDNNKLYFLQTKLYDNENDNSNVIYTEINGYKFMFIGDAGIEKEKDILEEYNISDIDVLKVGHHGSKTSSSEDFIDEINPKYSIISVGKNNRYGHPNKEVLNILEDSKIYRTDQDGSIFFTIKNNKLKIETCSP